MNAGHPVPEHLVVRPKDVEVHLAQLSRSLFRALNKPEKVSDVDSRSFFTTVEGSVESFQRFHIANELEEANPKPSIILGRWIAQCGVRRDAFFELLEKRPTLNYAYQLNARESLLNELVHVWSGRPAVLY